MGNVLRFQFLCREHLIDQAQGTSDDVHKKEGEILHDEATTSTISINALNELGIKVREAANPTEPVSFNTASEHNLSPCVIQTDSIGLRFYSTFYAC